MYANNEKEALKQNGWICPEDEYHEKTAWEEEQSDLDEQSEENRRYEKEYGPDKENAFHIRKTVVYDFKRV